MVTIKGRSKKLEVTGYKLHRFMPSLLEMELPAHAEYTKYEKLGVVAPSKRFNFLKPGTTCRVRQVCSDSGEPECKREKRK